MEKKQWEIFLSSLFFVLGFSIVFSLLGVLLQGILSSISYKVQIWLGRIGGIIIILFGLYVVGLIKPKFLERDYKIGVKTKFKSNHLTSFVFGAAFAVGWTPCIGPVLGAILTLAVTQPSLAFFFLLSYSLGLGIPFLLVGLFTNQAQTFINKYSKTFKYLNILFGGVLILLGIFVFTNQLARFANHVFASNILLEYNFSLGATGTIGIGIAFLAGLVSFLSPCVLPILPGFLTYLATVTVRKKE